MKLILLGAPGSGKGTQAEYISEKLSIPSVSTGAILRESVKNGTATGLKAKEYMDAGKLVPDEIILGIIEEKLKEDECKNGFIFDGFPRNIPQAEALEKITDVDCVLLFDVPDEAIESRMSGRRACKSCGKTFHITNNPSKTEGICDSCGGELVQRDDDASETVRKRLKIYHGETEPLIAFYRDRGKLHRISGAIGLDETREKVSEALGYNL
jgi:adenylate kinase